LTGRFKHGSFQRPLGVPESQEKVLAAADYFDPAALINIFRELTGFGVVVNTSFNVRGKPIVCSPEDAYRCFMGTEMDCL
jgi:hypothetical protein